MSSESPRTGDLYISEDAKTPFRGSVLSPIPTKTKKERFLKLPPFSAKRKRRL
jgi:hypothetical protein